MDFFSFCNRKMKLKLHNKNATLLNPSDIKNFLKLSNFETVRVERKILLPMKVLGLERFINNIEFIGFVKRLYFQIIYRTIIHRKR